MGKLSLYSLKVEHEPGNTAADEEVNGRHFADGAEVLRGVAEFLSGSEDGDGEQIVVQPGEIHARN